MKKLLLFLIFISPAQNAFSQPTGLLNETFNLKYLQVGDIYYTPNGENPNFTIFENSGEYYVEAGGIFNMAFGLVAFNNNTLTHDGLGVTLHDCVETNCYYENLYFYGVLTNSNMEAKTFTYEYNESNGIKYFRISDENYNIASFSNAPNEDPNPLLFQNWYLYKTEGDLGLDPAIHYTGPNPPQLTINPDLTFNGIEDCAQISGSFIFSEESGYPEFVLQPQNYVTDESNCSAGSPTYAMPELEEEAPLMSLVYTGDDEIDYLEYYSGDGVISYYRNVLILSTPENELSSLTIFPNPATDRLFIKSKIDSVNAISIMDINGRIVISYKNEGVEEVDVSNFTSGMYFIRIESSSGNIMKKFIKN